MATDAPRPPLKRFGLLGFARGESGQKLAVLVGKTRYGRLAIFTVAREPSTTDSEPTASAPAPPPPQPPPAPAFPRPAATAVHKPTGLKHY